MEITRRSFLAGLGLDMAAPGVEIRFRVRYIGKDRARFVALLTGRSADSGDRFVLPIESHCPLVG